MPTAEELKARIPGWGADLDPKNRPSVPRERSPQNGTGAHWDKPEQQVAKVKIFVSPEHKGITPVFGTSCPPRGLSGIIRQYAYTLSEGNKTHWVILLLADRIDVIEGMIGSLLRMQPHNPLKEMGLASEFKGGGFKSRFGQHRSDVKRMKREGLVLLGLGAAFFAKKALSDRKAA